MNDIRIIEGLDGGDLVVSGNDLELTNELKNQVYLGLFGGNVEESTNEVGEGERFDFWGNDLFHPDEPGFQFNSNFERTLNRVALNTQGIQELEQVGTTDLAFMRELGDYTLQIFVVAPGRIRIDFSIDLREEFRNLFTEREVSIDFVINQPRVIIWTDGVGNVWTDGVGNPFTDI